MNKNKLAILGKQFNKILNPTVNFENLKSNSDTKIVWMCEKSHTWETTFKHRYERMSSCPVCLNKVVLVGYNDLTTLYPEIAEQWNFARNTISINDVGAHSATKVWWQCAKGHEWEAITKNRTRMKQGCPVCKNKKVLSGYNDFNTTHPSIAKEWNHIKNALLTPENVFAGSKQKVWWVCDKGHEWETEIGARKSGTNCPVCKNHDIVEGFNDFTTTHSKLASQWHPTKNNSLKPEDFTYGSSQKIWWVCDKGHEWETKILTRSSGFGCPYCVNPTYVSKTEKEITDYLISLNVKVETQVRHLINKELDIYLPDQKIAIEYNGLYWHSEEKGKTKYYHYEKWKNCKDKGIQLIQIWEDDWNHNPELIKNMLAHKIGKSSQPKCYARNTKVVKLSQQEIEVFLNQNHIQGSANGSMKYGLIDQNSKIVAAIVLKTEPGTQNKTFNLLRFATSCSIPGGFTKLLKYVEKELKPEKIVTFSDNTLSEGNLYQSNGFTVEKELKPDYMYVIGRNRTHKFNYRLKKFRDDPTLRYEEELSERELALLNNIPRIWDAGKTKWAKQVVKN